METNEILQWMTNDDGELNAWIGFVLLLATAYLADRLARGVMLGILRRAAKRSDNRWDDALVRASFFMRIAHLVPALVVYFGIQGLDAHPTFITVVQRVALASLILFGSLVISSLLEAAHTIYSMLPDIGHRPIKGYLSFVRMGVYFIAVLLGVSVLMDRSPWIFLSGLGALTAVLLLVFRDTLLSLVASFQITSNQMLQIGDWIEMPQFGADGDVIDVALHTVKVQNWDKTITTIPTHALITGSFKNWRGMSESQSRRIKRSFFVDVTSIHFLDEDEIERFSKMALLADYITEKRNEIETDTRQRSRVPEIDADIRQLTNVGTLRAYIVRYLRNHPKIRQDQTLIVRQLAPGSEGLPIEIYCFSNDIAWSNYEDIQADLFDHVLASAPLFGLRIFQQPAGSDMQRWLGTAAVESPGAEVTREGHV